LRSTEGFTSGGQTGALAVTNEQARTDRLLKLPNAHRQRRLRYRKAACRAPEVQLLFASQAVYCCDRLGIPEERLNVDGGRSRSGTHSA
jgi:hypothetical protein